MHYHETTEHRKDCARVAEIGFFLFLIIITLSSFIWFGVRSIQREAGRFDSFRNHWPSAKVELTSRESENEERAQFVIKMTLEAWTAYQKSAWGFDALQADSKSGINDYHQHLEEFAGSSRQSGRLLEHSARLGRTLLTGMSTLWLMGQESQFALARHWVSSHLHFKELKGIRINVASAVQQYLGSLLSLYALTSEHIFLDKAIELAQVLQPAYQTPTGVPYVWLHLYHHVPEGRVGFVGQMLGQLLEYGYLSRLITQNVTRKAEYFKLQKQISQYRASVVKYFTLNGLHMDRLSASDFVPVSSRLSCFAWSDSSFIISVLKFYLQFNATETVWLDMFNRAFDEAQAEKIFSQTSGTPKNCFIHLQDQCAESASGSLYRDYFDPSVTEEIKQTEVLEEKLGNKVRPSMKAVSCYFGGLLSLAANALESASKNISKLKGGNDYLQRASKYLQLAIELTETCHRAAVATPTGLPPNKFYFDETENRSLSSNYPTHDYPLITEEGSFLSPELAESYFLLWRKTKDIRYREWAWSYAQAIHQYARSSNTGGGFSQIASTKTVPPPRTNYQPPHLIGATFKYLYLTFVDDKVLPLDKWVFNVAGQPLPVIGSSRRKI